jgi:uncharacterized SAM-binding protein YcdF (DUF218 family)
VDAAALDPLAVRAVLKALLLPPTVLILAALAGLVVARRRPHAGLWLASAAVTALLLLSVPLVASSLSRAWVGALAPLDLSRPVAAQAIVILGSGVHEDAPEWGGDTLGVATLERVRYGARVARATRLPVLVSGGRVRSTAAEADLMRAALEDELGVPVRWVESASRTTHENAQRLARLLVPAGVTEVVLVAHAVDMPRAAAEVRAAGLRVVPAPIDLPRRGALELGDFLPGVAGLQTSWRVVYEMAGEAARRLASPRA